jgi:hypothetical protein
MFNSICPYCVPPHLLAQVTQATLERYLAAIASGRKQLVPPETAAHGAHAQLATLRAALTAAAPAERGNHGSTDISSGGGGGGADSGTGVAAAARDAALHAADVILAPHCPRCDAAPLPPFEGGDGATTWCARCDAAVCGW